MCSLVLTGREVVRHSTSAFNLADLRHGLIHYISSNQSRSSSSESFQSSPLRDSFQVVVSDGLHNSSAGKVEIALDRSSESQLQFDVDPIQV